MDAWPHVLIPSLPVISKRQVAAGRLIFIPKNILHVCPLEKSPHLASTPYIKC